MRLGKPSGFRKVQSKAGAGVQADRVSGIVATTALPARRGRPRLLATPSANLRALAGEARKPTQRSRNIAKAASGLAAWTNRRRANVPAGSSISYHSRRVMAPSSECEAGIAGLPLDA